MDWIERINRAISFMEEHMTEDIDYNQVAKIACCSSYHFQRMFAYIANVPLPEYIRRRKMSLAAIDLQRGKEKIIDIALKYGYSSPTAFNRAFQSIHGIAPSRAKEDGVLLKSYPVISFKLIAKGVEEMEFKIEKKDEIRVLGVSTPISGDAIKAFEEAEALWLKILMDGAPKDEYGELLDVGTVWHELNAACDTKLSELSGFFGIEIERDDNHEYMIAVASTLPESDSLKEYIIPAHTWAVFPRENFFAEDYAEANSAVKFDERLYSEWLPTSGYEIANRLDIHRLLPTNDFENAPFERWLPVKKIDGTIE